MLKLYQLFFMNIDGNGLLPTAFGMYADENGVSSAQALILLTVLSILWVIASYFIGSLNFSIIISNKKYKDDIRKYGSQNAGSTNMQRVYGNKAAALTLLCDAAKGFVCVFVARLLFGMNVGYLAGTFCVIGHCFPAYFGFKGGKGVATAIAVVLTLCAPVGILLIIIFAILVLGTKYISLGSIIAALLYPVFLDRCYGLYNMLGIYDAAHPTAFMEICAVAITFIIIVRHHKNIKNLLNGEENKISLGKKKKNEESTENVKPRSLHNIEDEDDGDDDGNVGENGTVEDDHEENVGKNGTNAKGGSGGKNNKNGKKGKNNKKGKGGKKRSGGR